MDKLVHSCCSSKLTTTNGGHGIVRDNILQSFIHTTHAFLTLMYMPISNTYLVQFCSVSMYRQRNHYLLKKVFKFVNNTSLAVGINLFLKRAQTKWKNVVTTIERGRE